MATFNSYVSLPEGNVFIFQRWVGLVQTIHSWIGSPANHDIFPLVITHGWLWKPQKQRHKCASVWWFGTFFIFPYIAKSNPNWLIFFRGVETTNQECSWCSWSLHFFRNYWYKHSFVHRSSKCQFLPRLLPSGKHTKNYGIDHHFIAGYIKYFYGHVRKL